MAKHGIVALTRGFKFSEPKVYDTEGIKCFALAPWFADTALVHSLNQLKKNLDLGRMKANHCHQ